MVVLFHNRACPDWGPGDLSRGAWPVFPRRYRSWREKLLLAWIIVPLVFFQIWPVKGFQYLLPYRTPHGNIGRTGIREIGHESKEQPADLLVLQHIYPAGSALDHDRPCGTFFRWDILATRSNPRQIDTFLAGTGGVPGGRGAGIWIQANVPQNAQFMTIGPSMANIIEFYGARSAAGLAVSPNPLHRNPSYDPINNPDQQLRTSNLQYLVWDLFRLPAPHFFRTSFCLM